ncbi:MAG: DMT family transporter [Bacteroidales bacterium]|nr:DMT family transporter [Bacteroidales bacterium]
MARAKGRFPLFPFVVALVIVAIWGCTFVQTKILINAGLRPDSIFFFRFLIAYILLLPFAGGRVFLANIKDEFYAQLLGVTGGSLYFVTENYALAYGYCSNVSLIVCLTPLVTALLVGRFNRSERLGRAGGVASAIALAGILLVVFNGNYVLHLSPLGDLLALVACLCWAIYSLVIRGLQGKYSNLLITRKIFGYGLLTIIPLLLHNGLNVKALLSGGAVVWGNLLFLGCVASMFCFLGWNWCLKKIGTVRATNLLYLNPVIAVVTSAVVLGERVTPIAMAGAALILTALVCLDKLGRKR